MSRLNRIAAVLVRWVYPADRPSLLPFPVRHAASNTALWCLVRVYWLGRWLERGIGAVRPDKSEAKRF